MDLGFGFTKGTNRVSKQKVQYWLHVDMDINWKAFIWYITQHIVVEDYSDDWIDVKVLSEKQREYFYNKVRQYDDEIWDHNYGVDTSDESYKTHHRGYGDNKDIIERLVAEHNNG